MALLRLIMSGKVWDNTSGGNIVEEWSCGLSLLASDGLDVAGVLGVIDQYCANWFADSDTFIHGTVSLESVALNYVDVATGIQITDPTLETTYDTGTLRGQGSSGTHYPLGTSYRISLDAAIRDRTTKGGWYVPRTTMTIQNDGRFAASDVTAALGTADTLIDAINNYTGGVIDVGVWSRKNNSVTKSLGVRIGNVPDNISRRRRQLDEVYQRLEITT